MLKRITSPSEYVPSLSCDHVQYGGAIPTIPVHGRIINQSTKCSSFRLVCSRDLRLLRRRAK